MFTRSTTDRKRDKTTDLGWTDVPAAGRGGRAVIKQNAAPERFGGFSRETPPSDERHV